MKAAGKVLLAQQEQQHIDKQKKDLKSEMTNLAKDRKRQERKMRNLNAKAQKIDLTELMQMLMMKAFLFLLNTGTFVVLSLLSLIFDSPDQGSPTITCKYAGRLQLQV